MADPSDTSATEKHFLDVRDAEIVEGSDVIAEKVSGAPSVPTIVRQIPAGSLPLRA